MLQHKAVRGLLATPTSLSVLQAADTVKQQASQLASSKAHLKEATAAQKLASEVRVFLFVHLFCCWMYHVCWGCLVLRSITDKC